MEAKSHAWDGQGRAEMPGREEGCGEDRMPRAAGVRGAGGSRGSDPTRGLMDAGGRGRRGRSAGREQGCGVGASRGRGGAGAPWVGVGGMLRTFFEFIRATTGSCPWRRQDLVP